mmetsp:Transcript_44455/g.81152  ORF Transcript_44455/g.81152 Transcript_44455/m.81152 type:complete len:350 (-) Transcript_44455:68-1117(-)
MGASYSNLVLGTIVQRNTNSGIDWILASLCHPVRLEGNDSTVKKRAEAHGYAMGGRYVRCSNTSFLIKAHVHAQSITFMKTPLEESITELINGAQTGITTVFSQPGTGKSTAAAVALHRRNAADRERQQRLFLMCGSSLAGLLRALLGLHHATHFSNLPVAYQHMAKCCLENKIRCTLILDQCEDFLQLHHSVPDDEFKLLKELAKAAEAAKSRIIVLVSSAHAAKLVADVNGCTTRQWKPADPWRFWWSRELAEDAICAWGSWVLGSKFRKDKDEIVRRALQAATDLMKGHPDACKKNKDKFVATYVESALEVAMSDMGHANPDVMIFMKKSAIAIQEVAVPNAACVG